MVRRRILLGSFRMKRFDKLKVVVGAVVALSVGAA
jgi:hypothetical protein